MDHWFSQGRFGFMMHWGLYSLPAGEWKGQRCEYIGEWIQSRFRIPCAEYAQLCEAFNPVLFDADDTVRRARDCGMRYVVLTSKHHEGFAMYRSRVDGYNVYDATPFRRDPTAEFAEACYKYGLKLGLYYSQDLDWHDPDGGGYRTVHKNGGNMSWTNDWDFPDASRKDYSRCFERKIRPQVEEILTQYGELGLIWFDTPQTISADQSRELYDLVKRYQPNCLVNSRIGNNLGDYQSLGDNQIPAGIKGGAERSRGKDPRGNPAFRFFETAATLNNTWGYKSFDQDWKTPRETCALLQRLSSRNTNYLLNVGPDHLGRIPARAMQIMEEVGRWMETNGESIHGAQPNPFAAEPSTGPVTKEADTLYFFMQNPPADGRFAIHGLRAPVREARILGGGPLPFKQDAQHPAGRAEVALPALPAEEIPVLALRFDGPPQVEEGILQQADGTVALDAVRADIDYVLPEGTVLAPSAWVYYGPPPEGVVALGRAGDVEGWHQPNASLTWDFTLYTPGEYDIEIVSGAAWRGDWAGGQTLTLDVTAAEDSAAAEGAAARARGVLTYLRPLDPVTARNYRGAVGCMGKIVLQKPGALRAVLRMEDVGQESKVGFIFRSLRLVPAGK